MSNTKRNTDELYEEEHSAISIGTEAVYYNDGDHWYPVLDGIDFDSKNFQLAVIGDPDTGIYTEYRLLGDAASSTLDNAESMLMSPIYGETKLDSRENNWREWPASCVETTYATSVLSNISNELKPSTGIHPAENPLDEDADGSSNLAQLYEVTIQSGSLGEYEPLFMKGKRKHDSQSHWFPVIDRYATIHDGLDVMIYLLADHKTGAYSHLDCPNFAGARTILCTADGLPSPEMLKEDLEISNCDGLIPRPWPAESVWETICESNFNRCGISKEGTSTSEPFEEMILPESEI